MVQITVGETVDQVRLYNEVLHTGTSQSKAESSTEKAPDEYMGFIGGDRLVIEPTFTSHMKTPSLCNSNDRLAVAP